MNEMCQNAGKRNDAHLHKKLTSRPTNAGVHRDTNRTHGSRNDALLRS